MLDRLKRFSSGFSLIALAASIGLLFYNPWLAFLPVALWIGWFQIGSL